MGLPVTVYRSTDVGAPQLINGKPSSWINILKKVLVDGYGDKAPLGWTLEFEDTSVFSVAFRNSLADSGSGCFAKFYSTTNVDGNYAVLGMNCCQSMSDINTLIKPVGARGISTNSSVPHWQIIGTSRGFYISCESTIIKMGSPGGGNVEHQCYFIGDFESSVIGDTSPYTIVSGTNGAGDVISSNGLNFYTNYMYSNVYATDGSSGSVFCTITKPLYYTGSTSPDGDAELLGINHLMTNILIYNANIAYNSNLILPRVRGSIPGLYCSSFAGYRFDSWPKDLTQGGFKWTLLRGYASPQFWIKASTWYD
jgi:hypothetical protein